MAYSAVMSVQYFGEIGQLIRKLNWRHVVGTAIVLSFVKEGKYAIQIVTTKRLCCVPLFVLYQY